MPISTPTERTQRRIITNGNICKTVTHYKKSTLATLNTFETVDNTMILGFKVTVYCFFVFFNIMKI